MTDTIKQSIPLWLTDEEIKNIKAQFVGESDDDFLTPEKLRNPNNWKRISKYVQYDYSKTIRCSNPKEYKKLNKQAELGIERVFDFKPADDQLRLTVIADVADICIKTYSFQGE